MSGISKNKAFEPEGCSERCRVFQGPSSRLPVDSLDLTDQPHPRIPVQAHILNVGGDALRANILTHKNTLQYVSTKRRDPLKISLGMG
jgi:hypothetical protein